MTDEFDVTMASGYQTPGRRKNKWDATAAPAVTDDEDLGYSVGSMWVDTVGGDAYICVDPADGAAVWVAIT